MTQQNDAIEPMNEFHQILEAFIKTMDTRLIRTKVFHAAIANIVTSSRLEFNSYRNGRSTIVKAIDYHEAAAQPLLVGALMEKTDRLLTDIQKEMEETKTLFPALIEQIRALAKLANAEISDAGLRVRESYVSSIGEIHHTLPLLSEVRQFFPESNYSVELRATERVLELCAQLKRLQEHGMFDAIFKSSR